MIYTITISTKTYRVRLVDIWTRTDGELQCEVEDIDTGERITGDPRMLEEVKE